MKKSGLADSPFFTPPADDQKLETGMSSDPDTVVSSNHDTTTQTEVPTSTPIVQGKGHGLAESATTASMVEAVRQAVKEVGKEAATQRFTTSEKEGLAAIVYGFRQEGIRTSETEITRIAINAIMREYEERGDKSLLSKVLTALNA